MSDVFDPYYRWLGISPQNQPPDHYELLGVERFEGNPRVIDEAADRQSRHVRTFQLGPHAVHSQQLLNEISTARVCLLNAEKKARYDESLGAASAGDPVAPAVKPVPVLQFAATARQASSEQPAALSQRSGRRLAAIVLGAVAAVMVVGVIAVFYGGGDAKRNVANRDEPAPQHTPAATETDDIGNAPDNDGDPEQTPAAAGDEKQADSPLRDTLAGEAMPPEPAPDKSPVAPTPSSPVDSGNKATVKLGGVPAKKPAKKLDRKKPLSLPDLIEKVEPSVVLIRVTGAGGKGVGSGFVVDRRGYIATNYHVVEGAQRAEVVFRDKSHFEVKGFLAATREKDLAILKIDCPADKLIAVALAGKLPRKGEQVAALGAPKGFDFTTSDGIVSAIRSGRDIRASFLANIGTDVYAATRYSLDMTWIQTSAPISPGNSGGPLVNMVGEVVGVNTWKYRDGQNLNFAGSALEVTALLKRVKGKPRPLNRLHEADLLADAAQPPEGNDGQRGSGEVRRFSKHSTAVRAIAVSRDGRYIATAGEDKFCYVLDGKTLDVVRRFGPHTAPMTGVAFMPDATVVFSTLRDKVTRASIYVWDWRAQRIRTQIPDSNQDSYGVAVSPDGLKLAVSMGAHVARVYYPRDGGRFGLETPFKDRPCNAVAFSRDSRMLAMGSGGGIIRWLVVGLQRRSVGGLPPENTTAINSLVFSPDGTYLLSGHTDRTLRMWNFLEGGVVAKFEGHRGEVTSGRFSVDGKKMVSGSLDKTVRVWDTSKRKLLREFKGHDKGVTGVAFLPDGDRVVSASLDGTVRIWSLKKTSPVRPPVVSNPPRGLPDGAGGSGPKLANDPVPDAVSLAKAGKLLGDLYRDDYAKAVTPTLKRKLAIKVMRQGASAENSPAERYASFRAAKTIATQVGSVALALEAVDLFEAWFDVDAEALRAETIERLAPQVHTAADRVLLTEAALVTIDRLIARDQYDRATRLIEFASSAANHAKSRTLLEMVRDRSKQIEVGKELWLNYRRAVQTLKGRPDDPTANLQAGKYLCFTKGRWKQGLRHLSKGSDAELKAVAVIDLAGPDTAEQRAAAGARWGKLALGVDESRRKPYLAAAQFWYLQAVGELTGLRKRRVERELKSIGEIPTSQRRR
ncbi:MAG: trypsin-like peptidase domain-containing protein [Planctomycetes bacterium]|nr:trypsin-like peptidase domain-containing protein [Planctomycetota bacterium]